MHINNIMGPKDCDTRSEYPDVQEMVERYNRHEEFDCLALDDGHRAFIGAVYMDVTENPNWHPTPHILSLIQDINGKMAAASAAE
jgi:hypothetical protein